MLFIGYNCSCNIFIRNMTELLYPKPVELLIRKKLKETFLPVHMDVTNESYMHNVPKGSETHFKVIVVSKKFENMPLIKVKVFEELVCH
jgi:acid stress-induced BolA-like protein IbaG/YrbA